ncbi:tetraspanin-7-like [Liolophura sinensis]|uniref:tetraspanin-7-like n=1 Tax=Liolophura sinensis TaxID=3198878 RepID=UPI003158D043
MNCVAKFGKFILVSLNIFFIIISIVLIVLGALVKWGQNLLSQYLNPLLSGLNSAVGQAGLGNVDLSGFDLGVLLGDVAVALIIMGCILLFISIMGCCGACCQVRWMLIVYAIIISLVFLAQVIIVILLFAKTEEMRDVIKGPMRTSIRDGYVSFNSTDIISLGWNFAMMTFSCCGVDNYMDFDTATKWPGTYYVDDLGETVNLTTPVACCKVEGTFPNFSPPSNYNCTFSPTANNSNYMNGCYQAIEDFVFVYDAAFIGVGVGLAIFQICLIIFSCLLCKEMGKDNSVKPYD